MFVSYLRIALRNFSRQKTFSVINVVGLALGMSVGLLLISFYSFVSSFDDFHLKGDRIYRIVSTAESGIERKDLASAPLALGSHIKDGLPEIDDVVQIYAKFHESIVVEHGDIPIRTLYTDPSFFSVFDFALLQGNANHALTKPNSIVLTETLAIKLSGSTDMVGKSIEVKGLGQLEVTGVVENQIRTHLWFEALVSINTLQPFATGVESDASQWYSYEDQYVYILLNSSDNADKITSWLQQFSAETYRESDRSTFKLQALSAITPGPDLDNALGPDTDYVLIIVFATICLLILVPACFNYANISIARALKRYREIGVRKTMGAARKQILVQFIGETIAMTLLSLLGAILIFLFIRPEFENLMPGGWLDLTVTLEMIAIFVGFAIMTGALAGLFPAMYFSGINPIQALKGKTVTGVRSKMLGRKTLVIVQFAVSFCFIVLLILLGRQYRYNLHYNYGFNTENIIDVRLGDVNPNVLTAEFSRIADVQKISLSSGILGKSFSEIFVHQPHTRDSIEAAQLFVDSLYVGNMELKLLGGRNFDQTSFEKQLIVNEEFLKRWNNVNPTDAIGMTFVINGTELEVIGVLQDFHFESLLVPIKPFLLRSDPSLFEYANVKVKPTDVSILINNLEAAWDNLSEARFEARFFDDELEELYQFYRALMEMIGYLGLLAMSISILGLLGMVVYTTENRTKEIGVRKVFGANALSIVLLLSKDFLNMMAVAVILALPACNYLFGEILSLIQYYHVTFGIWDIIMGIFVFFFAGSITIVSTTLRAARQTPVTTLKHE